MTATDGKVSCGRFPSTTVTYNNYTIPFQRRKTKQEKIWTMKVDLNQVSQKRLPQLLVLLSIYKYMHTFYIFIFMQYVYMQWVVILPMFFHLLLQPKFLINSISHCFYLSLPRMSLHPWIQGCNFC